MMISLPELVEFLLNRRTESSKTGKEWKFTIIQRSIHSENAELLLTSRIYTQFLRYIRDGPFYIDVQPATAVESSR
jgi:26S proteasome non-ATPase regulatory subunit 5